jgi:hypothetical protein
MRTVNEFFEDVTRVEYLRKTAANLNYIRGDIRSGLNSGNASYCSVKNPLSSRHLSTVARTKIYGSNFTHLRLGVSHIRGRT